MAEAAKDQDQSMEDILQSIKRIIAEEGEPAPEAAGSDVLELTELLAEDGSVSKPVNEAPLSIDEIMAAPISSTPSAEEPVAMPEPAPVAAPAPMPAPAKPVAMEEPAPQSGAATQASTDESLISGETFSASMAALSALRDSLNTPAPTPAARPSMGFRSGTTVEDLAREALKPMLKEWLDQNLPSIVETLVQREISKFSQR